jgi:mRNA interferase RelE/StbE
MPFTIELAAEAVEDLRALKASTRSIVGSALEAHLRHAPTKTSRSRIKRLRDIDHPQYRLRIGGIRVFYDVFDQTVVVMAIVDKSEAAAWLARFARRA